jgi:putative nucleotidyltransferase with HDIG domain
MTKRSIASLKPITVTNFANLSRTTIPPVLHSAEFRLLSFSHNVEHHRLEVNCFRMGWHVKATLPELNLDALKPFVGRTVRLDFHQTSSGFEPLLSIQYLSAVEDPSDPLATFMPLWLDPAQHSLFDELVRLVGQLEAPYRELVLEVFRDDEMLWAFLDRPASLGYHHNKRGGLLAHTIEVALDCEQACSGYPGVNASLTVAGALLHDIGKCLEYQQNSPNRYRRSHSGELEMHKTQGVRIVSIAAHQCEADPLMVSEICHLLMAANGPQYMGLPNVKMAEAVILQSADGRSSSVNLFETKRPGATSLEPFGGPFRVPPQLGSQE